jgi:hypothetical protein
MQLFFRKGGQGFFGDVEGLAQHFSNLWAAGFGRLIQGFQAGNRVLATGNNELVPLFHLRQVAGKMSLGFMCRDSDHANPPVDLSKLS